MAGKKKAPEEMLHGRIVVTCTKQFEAEYDEYCKAIGEQVAPHVRSMLEAEIALRNASKA